MCNRHSFIVTRSGKVFDGYGFTDSHTMIRQLAGLSTEDSSTYAFEWQPPTGWPDTDWNGGLTQDTAPIPCWDLKAKHFNAIERHLRRLYPDMIAWRAGDTVRALPDGLSVGGWFHTTHGTFRSVANARKAMGGV